MNEIRRISTTARGLLVLLVAVAVLVPTPGNATDPNPIVSVVTPLGTFEIELFHDDAPVTVANFLKYISDGDYVNSFFHRSVPGFIIQGGGFTYENGQSTPVPADPPIVNEFGRSNLRGTVAMAKSAGNPNSATSHWFVNLVNNQASLDGQNGGFTVFGRVLGNGMDVVDALAAVPVFNGGGVFAELPLRDFALGDTVTVDNLLTTDLSLTNAAPPPVAPLLLRKSTNRSWFSYRLHVDDSGVTIDEKGSVKLTRDRDFETVSRADFDGDGEPDALLRDLSETKAGAWSLATLVGKTITGQGTVAMTTDSDWRLMATGDIDGDGKVDAVLRNVVDGRWRVYLLDGRTVLADGFVDLSDSLADVFVASGDFNGDGRLDVLLRRANGTWLAYLLDGTGKPKSGRPKISSDARDTFRAAGDFDGNGTTDVLVRRTDGRWFLYLLKGTRVTSGGIIALTDDPDFELMAHADFNGDGTIDVLVRDDAGDWILYALDGRKIVADGSVAMSADTGYTMVSNLDYNDDGMADALLHHSNGRWLLYTLDGSAPRVLRSVVPKISTAKAWVPQLD